MRTDPEMGRFGRALRTEDPDRAPRPAGTRVKLRYTLLPPAERAPGLPVDTSITPYVIRVNGILEHPAGIGAEATVRTASGRLLTGMVEEIGPGDRHTFGRPATALVEAIEAIHRLARTLT